MGSGMSGLYNNTYGGRIIDGIDYNTAGSTNVKLVNCKQQTSAHALPATNTPNSVIQNFRDGKLLSERYYDKDGNAYLDIDYTNHGNPKTHKHVPHEHEIFLDKNGKIHRNKDRSIKNDTT